MVDFTSIMNRDYPKLYFNTIFFLNTIVEFILAKIQVSRWVPVDLC